VTPTPIPVAVVRGSHREAGRQIGEATADAVRAMAELAGAPERLRAAAPYRAAVAQAMPWLLEELDGVAEGAGVDAMALFAASIEELDGEQGAPSQVAVAPAAGRCSDLVAVPPATADGHVLVAHNNDLAPESEAQLVALERHVEGEPALFTIGIGPFISVGWNDAGLSLTGNELSPNDERLGVPRLLQVRDILRRRTLADAVSAALDPRRASSYNNLLAHRDGGAVSVEGSATDAELLRPDERGALAHTNHYTCERMLRYEGDPAYARRSAVRLGHARRRLDGLAPGTVTMDVLRDALCDHEGGPDALCRHGEVTKTVFWCVADLTERVVRYGRGNPCDSQEQRHDL
jgi:isopenicillin-N N-acyltransferase like protein